MEGIDLSQLSGQDDKQRQQQLQQQKEREEAKNLMLAQVLEQGARERIGKIRLVKPKLAEEVEMNLLRMAQSGQLRAKISEKQLQQFLEKMTEKKEDKPVIFKRSSLDDDW